MEQGEEDGVRLHLQPITFREACRFISQHHRHHLPPKGYKFGIGVNDGERVVGVITVGRPVARALDDGWTAEVTRCCTDGTPHVASKLYAAAWRAARAMGHRRLITYTLVEEPRYEILPREGGERARHYTPDFDYREGEQLVAEEIKGGKATMTDAASLRMSLFRRRYTDIELRVVEA